MWIRQAFLRLKVALLLPILAACWTVPDEGRGIGEIIVSRGFQYQTHHVTTKDGYILGVHRIVNTCRGVPMFKASKGPVVLQHGLFGSALGFLNGSPDGECSDAREETNNLAFFLAKKGYDVWLPNSRGTKSSRNHTRLNPDKDKEFWKFTYHEMAKYDSPAVIDYILARTKRKSLAWIGHSQGTTMIFALLSMKPEYSAKIKPFIALAPVVYLKHTLNPVLRTLADSPISLEQYRSTVREVRGPERILGNKPIIDCSKHEALPACITLHHTMFGFSPVQLNITRLRIYVTQQEGTSFWNLVHFVQQIRNGGFQYFDRGTEDNLRFYGGPNPPSYKLSRIDPRNLAIIYSLNDKCTVPMDIHKLKTSLRGPPRFEHVVANPQFNHVDFLSAIHGYKLVNRVVLKILEKLYES